MLQVIIFLVIVFAAPWVIAPWLPQQPQTTWEIIASFVPGVWAPTIAATLLILFTDGFGGFLLELRERFRIRPNAARYLILAIVIPVVVVLAGIWLARIGGATQPFVRPADLWSQLLIVGTTGAIGEELGWRGFLLARLSRRLSQAISATLMAVLWALWHLPVFLYSDSPYATWPAVPALLTIVAFGAFMAGLFYRTDGCILPTMLAHFTFNLSLGAGGAPLSSKVLWGTTLVLFTVSALFLLKTGIGEGQRERGSLLSPPSPLQ